MQHDKKKLIRLSNILATSATKMREAKISILWILGLGMFVPEFLISLIFDHYGTIAADQLREVSATNLQEILVFPLNFLRIFLPFLVVFLFLSLTSYFALIELALSQFHDPLHPCSVKNALKRGIKLALTKGWVQLILLSFLLGIGQTLIFPAIILGVLSTIAPVLLVAERKGPWKALMDAILLKWLRGSDFSGAATFSVLLYVTGLFYLYAFFLSALAEKLLTLDSLFPSFSSVYLWLFESLPFGPSYVLVDSFLMMLAQLGLTAFAYISTCIYATIAKQRDLAMA